MNKHMNLQHCYLTIGYHLQLQLLLELNVVAYFQNIFIDVFIITINNLLVIYVHISRKYYTKQLQYTTQNRQTIMAMIKSFTQYKRMDVDMLHNLLSIVLVELLIIPRNSSIGHIFHHTTFKLFQDLLPSKHQYLIGY